MESFFYVSIFGHYAPQLQSYPWLTKYKCCIIPIAIKY